MTTQPRAAIFIVLLTIALAGCDNTASQSAAELETAADILLKAESAAVAGLPAELTMQRWARSCAACHVTGIAGAPRTGFRDEWAPRLAQGKDVLLKHTVEGKGKMPPLGYCSACEKEDFVAMIEFMADAQLGEEL